MAQKDFEIEINRFETLNTRDSAATVEDEEMPYCQNLQPIGTCLYTIPGVSAVLAVIGNGETKWTADTITALGTIRIPTTYNGFYYMATARSGTFKTGLTEPAAPGNPWPLTEGGTVVDNEVTWTAHSLTIKRMYDMNVGGTVYKFVATSGGALYRLNASYTQVRLWPTGSSVDTVLSNPKFDQIGSQWLLLIDPAVGFAVYNGTTFTRPTGGSTVLGTCIAYHASRVWVANGRTISYSAVLSASPAVADFNNCFTGTGSGSVVDNYASLRNIVNELKATQEYLYVVGDHAVHIISGVQLVDTGSTTFSLADSVPGIGTPWPDTVQVISGTLFLANEVGAYAVKANEFELISSYMDGMFTRLMVDLTASGFYPVGFMAKINNKLCYCLLAKQRDLLDGTPIKTIWCFYESKWFTIYYGQSYDFLTAASWFSVSDTTSFASYGSSLVQIFIGTSVTNKKFRTKASSHGYPVHDKQVISIGAKGIALDNPPKSAIALLSALGDEAMGSAYVNLDPVVIVWLNSLGEQVTLSGFNCLSPLLTIFGAKECDGRGKNIQTEYSETSDVQYILTSVLLKGQIGASW